MDELTLLVNKYLKKLASLLWKMILKKWDFRGLT